MIWLCIVLYLLVLIGSVAGWYVWSVRSNKLRAVQILYWIENALGGHGHVTGIRWISISEFEVPVRLASNLFKRANILVKISAYKLPLRWIMARLQAPEPETLTFQADLDLHPAFNLELHNSRWFARSRPDIKLEAQGWQFDRCIPVVLTTKLDWQKELTSAIQSVLGQDDRENLHVVFRRRSPHFSATLPLEVITPDSNTAVFDILSSIASQASAKAS